MQTLKNFWERVKNEESILAVTINFFSMRYTSFIDFLFQNNHLHFFDIFRQFGIILKELSKIIIHTIDKNAIELYNVYWSD